MLMNTTINFFRADHYGPSINKLDFYLPRVTILGKICCGKTRRFEDFEIRHTIMDAKSLCNYAEHLYLNFSIKSNLNTMAATGQFTRRVFIWTISSVKKTTILRF